MAGRPYDLRQACITRWLNAGVPIAEVARRVGNSPEVIHRRYHGCVYGHEEVATVAPRWPAARTTRGMHVSRGG